MKAALIREFNKDFVIEDVDTPQIGEGEALVEVRASCLCAADVKIRAGSLPTLKLPHIPGHELAGVVRETGKGVQNVKPGDRVVVYMYTVCGSCHSCLAGRENLCENIVRLGLERSGGHAQYVVVPERQLLLLPDSIPFEKAAAIPDAVSTMLHAIRDVGQVRLNDYVVLLGVGGLGMQGVQLARLSGGRVIAVARHEEKLKAARDLGAEWTFNGKDETLAQEIIDATDGRGADVVFDLVSTQETFQTAADCVKKGGSIVVIGSSSKAITFQVIQVMFKEIAVKGALGMKKETVLHAIDLCRSGLIEPLVTERYPLQDINRAAERLGRGEIIGRSVILPWE